MTVKCSVSMVQMLNGAAGLPPDAKSPEDPAVFTEMSLPATMSHTRVLQCPQCRFSSAFMSTEILLSPAWLSGTVPDHCSAWDQCLSGRPVLLRSCCMANLVLPRLLSILHCGPSLQLLCEPCPGDFVLAGGLCSRFPLCFVVCCFLQPTML